MGTQNDGSKLIFCSKCRKITPHEDLGWAFGSKRYQCTCGKRNEAPDPETAEIPGSTPKTYHRDID